MIPCIGRIVHYQSHGSADGTYASECRAAVITALCDLEEGLRQEFGEHCLSLAVLNPEGMFFKQCVPLDETNKFGGSWHWPERLETGEDYGRPC
jgi:hypothetical protein